MRLMAVNDVRPLEVIQKVYRESMRLISGDRAGSSNQIDPEFSLLEGFVAGTESEKPSLDSIGHTGRKLEGVSFAAADNSAVAIEESGGDMGDP